MQVIIVGETKIDLSYPDSQFNIPGYVLYRNDRKKGEGGVLAYVSSDITCKRLKTCRNYKTIEPVALHIMLRTKSVIVACTDLPNRLQEHINNNLKMSLIVFVTGLLYKVSWSCC